MKFLYKTIPIYQPFKNMCVEESRNIKKKILFKALHLFTFLKFYFHSPNDCMSQKLAELWRHFEGRRSYTDISRDRAIFGQFLWHRTARMSKKLQMTNHQKSPIYFTNFLIMNFKIRFSTTILHYKWKQKLLTLWIRK